MATADRLPPQTDWHDVLSARGLLTMLLAGAMATVAFDFFGQSLSPALGFANLAPVPLANNVIQVLFGEPWQPGAEFLHYFAGLVAYPLGWMLIARPLADRLAPGLPLWLSAGLYGVGLWVFALYVMAHLIAGNPPFLAFTGITWVALVGHVLFAWVAAAIVRWRDPDEDD
jgi:hypothetical protein